MEVLKTNRTKEQEVAKKQKKKLTGTTVFRIVESDKF